tara:strand:- start:223 stop:429 length:207 start_codon:yes stop_codon:yes gene_type:complete
MSKWFLLAIAIAIILKLNDVVVVTWEELFYPFQMIALAGLFFALLYIIMIRKNRSANEDDKARSKKSN